MFDRFSLNLHYFLFSESFKLQSSEAQKSEWLAKIESLEIIGCYAQTELGHGSNVRGIETFASFGDNLVMGVIWWGNLLLISLLTSLQVLAWQLNFNLVVT